MADEADQWRQWLGRHGPALLLFARQWSATQADAEDALQDGFIRFWKMRDKLARAGRDELSYVYACVRSAAMDLGRSRRRRDARERGAGPFEHSPFEFAVERAEREAMIESALNQLPGDQREVVVMKIWGELTFAQIAEALSVPPNTVASRYRYALAKLEAELSQELARE